MCWRMNGVLDEMKRRMRNTFYRIVKIEETTIPLQS